MHTFILSPESLPGGVLRALTAMGIELTVADPRDGHADGDGLRQVRISARGDRSDPMDLRWSRKSLRGATRLRPTSATSSPT